MEQTKINVVATDLQLAIFHYFLKLNLIRPNGFTRDHYLNHDRKSVTLILQRTSEVTLRCSLTSTVMRDWPSGTPLPPLPSPPIPRYQTLARHNILQEALHHQISQQDRRSPLLRLR